MNTGNETATVIQSDNSTSQRILILRQPMTSCPFTGWNYDSDFNTPNSQGGYCWRWI